jgi:predicted amidohydrolase
MRIALAQTAFTPTETSESFREIEKWAAEASIAGANLIAFPELFVCGYLNAVAAQKLSLTASELTGHLSRIARRHGIAICVGYAERGGTALYNSAMLVGSDGDQLLNYRKMHLWGDREKSLFSRGEPSAVVQIQPDCSVGILICYDLDFPAAMQDLQRRGADMVVAISATGRDYSVVPRMQVPTRAYENSLCVAFCNHVGGDGDGAFAGESAIAAPDGSFLTRGSGAGEDLVIADFKICEWERYRSAHRYVDDQRIDHFPLRPLTATK